MTAWVDLHLHSHCSDGAEAPEQITARAAAAGATAIALTDHDTVDGVAAAQNAAKGLEMGFLTGVEISAAFEGLEMHVVGLGVNTEDETLRTLLRELAVMRRNRMRAIYKRLHELRIPVDMPRHEEFESGLGRMHVAVTLRDLCKAATVQDAFDRYLNRGRPAYVPKQLPEAIRAIEAIHASGGLAFIAHPGLGQWIMKRLDILLTLPFDGLEAWHSSHNKTLTRELIAIAKDSKLLVSGGSDCHGDIKGEGYTLGRVKASADCYYRIAETLFLNFP